MGALETVVELTTQKRMALFPVLSIVSRLGERLDIPFLSPGATQAIFQH